MLLGVASHQSVYDLLEMVCNQDAQNLLDRIDQMADEGKNFVQLLRTLLQTFEQLITFKVTQKTQQPQLATLSEKLSMATLQLYYQITQNGYREIDYANTPASGFKMTLLRLMAFRIEQNQVVPQPTSHPAHALRQTPSTKQTQAVPAATPLKAAVQKAAAKTTSAAAQKQNHPEPTNNHRSTATTV